MARASRAVNGGQALDAQGVITNWVDTVARIHASIDPFGPIRVSEYQPVFSSQPLPISKITDRTTGTTSGAAVEYDSGEFVLDAPAGETACLTTGQRGRYQSGLIGVPGIGWRRDSAALSGTDTHYFGYFDLDLGASPETINNGFGFKETAGDTLETVVIRNGSEVYTKDRSEWLDRLDGTGGENNPSGLKLETTDGLVARFPFGYYGYMSLEWGFIVSDDPDNGDKFIVVDRKKFVGEQSLPYANLAIMGRVTGDSGSKAYITGRQYGVFGQLNLRRRLVGEVREAQSVGTSWEPLISARVRQTNPYDTIPIQLAGLGVTTDNDMDLAVMIGSDLNTSGSPPWAISQFSQGDTSTEFNLDAAFAGSLAFGGGEIVGGPYFFRGGGGSNIGEGSIDVPNQDIPVGEPITLIGKARSTTANVDTSMRMAELR